MNDYKLDLEKYATLARQAAAEGCVLLENEKQALPLREGESVAVFGRMAFHYYKSGLGSGGLVNTRYVVGILDALKECKEIQLDEKLLGIYANWIKENPYDEGQGWGRVPWSQKEMEVTEEMLDCARSNDVSLVIIGRTAGEDQDNNKNLGKVKNRYESEQIFNNINYLNVATNLAFFELTGKAQDITEEVGTYRAVTAEQIQATSARCFVPENCSILYYKAIS